MNILKKHYPFIILASIVIILAVINFHAGTLLTGGDNLHPEFDLPLNIERSLFAVWQEYQGPGLLGGMGHSADLLHQLFLLVISIALPMIYLRYFYTLLTLFIGGIGAYILIRYVLGVIIHEEKERKILALAGSVFYILNLSTIQSYYIPFEVFTAHFAALPWLLWGTLKFFSKPSRKNTLLLAILLIVATPAAYVPTLFVVYCVSAAILAVVNYVEKDKLIVFAKLFTKFVSLIILINAFWLLPFLYFTLTSANVNVNSKINEMATDTIFLLNKETGSLNDVLILKGFWFNNVEPNLVRINDYTLLPWKQYLANPSMLILAYLFAATVILGIAVSLRAKKRLLISFAVLLLFGVTMLATDTPPFSWIDNVMRTYIPFASQVFRFPFTKFSILTSLTYAIFFPIGISTLSTLFRKKIRSLYPLSWLFIALLILYCLPAFEGKLFYEKETIKLPQEYLQTFKYFQKQDPTARIADFPQSTFWGWNFYSWGYSGSGFLWYGITQPILDRAFDPWSVTSETYYFELAKALYDKDPRAFNAVLQKYQVRFLLVDKNVLNYNAPKSLFTAELETLIRQNPSIAPAATFGNIDIYKVTLNANPHNFVFGTSSLPTVNSYGETDLDKAYQDVKNYISQAVQPFNHSTVDLLYPFRSLLSNKTSKEEEYTVKEDSNSIYFVSQAFSLQNPTTLSIPELANQEHMVSAQFTSSPDTQGNIVITIKLLLPQVYLEGKKIWGPDIEQPIFVIPADTNSSTTLNVNGAVNYTVHNQNQILGTTLISLDRDNLITLSNSSDNSSQTYTLPADLLKSLPALTGQSVRLPAIKNASLVVKIPKVEDNYFGQTVNLQKQNPVVSCDTFRDGPVKEKKIGSAVQVSAQNASGCFSVYFPTVPHDQGYLIMADGKHEMGQNPHFWLLNEDEKYSPIDTYIVANNQTSFNANFVIPPMEEFGRAYSIHFDTISIGSDKTINTLARLSMFPIPYTFLTSLRVGTVSTASLQNGQFLTTHPNESLYILSGIKSLPKTIVLSQSYDPAWRAYQVTNPNWLTTLFPFVFGKELKQHVEINNWENGWITANSQQPTVNSQIDIIYLPQYLEYIGFILLLATLDFLLDPLSRISQLLDRRKERIN